MDPEVESILGKLEGKAPEEGIEEAREYLEQGDPTEEERDDLVYGIAVGYFHLGAHKRTLQWLEKSNDDRRALLSGFCYMENDQYEKAADALERASELQPEYESETHIMKGQAHFFNEDYDQARSVFHEVLEHPLSDDQNAETLLSLSMVEMSDDNVQQARDHLQKIVTEFSHTDFKLEAMYYLCESLESLGKVDEAVEFAERLKREGEDTSWEERAGELLQRLRGHQSNREEQLRNYEF
ncbi:MAG: tetratricopeptide repeat protein [bacterium]